MFYFCFLGVMDYAKTVNGSETLKDELFFSCAT